MKEVWLILKKYLELFISVGCALLTSWFDKIELLTLQKISNILMILLMTIGLIKFIFANVKLPNWLSKLVHTQKPIKSVDYMNDPIEVGEKTGQLVSDTLTLSTIIYKGGKKFMKKILNAIKGLFVWLWGNKAQLADAIYVFLTGVVLNVLIYSDIANMLLPEYLAVDWFKIAITVVSVVMTILSWINTATSRKFDSLATLTEVQKAKEDKKAQQTLNAEQLAKYNSIKADLLKRKVEIEAVIVEATKEIEKINARIELGISSEIVEHSNLSKLQATIVNAQNDLATLDVNIQTVESKINEYK